MRAYVSECMRFHIILYVKKKLTGICVGVCVGVCVCACMRAFPYNTLCKLFLTGLYMYTEHHI